MKVSRGRFRGGKAFGIGVVRLALGVLLALVGNGLAVAGTPVDLNQAGVEELAALPGIGPARAEAIVERRSRAGFEAPEDLMEIPGIGKVVFEGLRGQVVVGKSGPGVEVPAR